MTKKTDDQTIKEIYRKSKERVSMTLRLLEFKKQADVLSMADSEFIVIEGLLSSVFHAQKNESPGIYREIIIDLANWTTRAFTKQYIKSNDSFPAVRRGIELLHLLLQRDLRRRNMSALESQQYHTFMSMKCKLPEPTDQCLDAQETDKILSSIFSKIS